MRQGFQNIMHSKCCHNFASEINNHLTVYIMSTSLTTLVNQTLPAVSNSSVTYNADRNMFLTTGHTSTAGNTYFQGIQLSDRLAIVQEIGVGHTRTFLNGMKLYCFDGTQKKLIGSRYYDCYFYNDLSARKEAAEILCEYLQTQAKLIGANVSSSQLEEYAKNQVLAAASHRHNLLS